MMSLFDHDPRPDDEPIADDEPLPIDKSRVSRKLEDYATSTRAASAILFNHTKLVEAQIAVATDLQELIGPDVVIYYKGLSFVPFVEGNRTGYKIMPVYDLDAALMDEQIETKLSHAFDPQPFDPEYT
jgi:hypothetical protein